MQAGPGGGGERSLSRGGHGAGLGQSGEAELRDGTGALGVVVQEGLDPSGEQRLVGRLVLPAHVTAVPVEQGDRIGWIERSLQVVVAQRLVDREQVVGEAVGDQQRRGRLLGDAVGAVEQVVGRVVLRDLGDDRLVLGIAVVGLAGVERAEPVVRSACELVPAGA